MPATPVIEKEIHYQENKESGTWWERKQHGTYLFQEAHRWVWRSAAGPYHGEVALGVTD